MTGSTVHDWDELTRSFREDDGPGTWRRVCDALHRVAIDRWFAGHRSLRVLKTDLFDESTADGLVSVFVRDGAAVYGIDISAQVVASAARPGLHGVVGDVRCLPYPDASFDTIVSNSTLDHFSVSDDLTSALRELRRVAAPGARVVVTLDNPSNPVIRLRGALPYRWLHRIGVVPYFVGCTLDDRSLRAELRALGFRVEETQGLMHVPRVAAVAAASIVDRVGARWASDLLVRVCRAFEVLERLPTRRWTAHFVVAVASVPER